MKYITDLLMLIAVIVSLAWCIAAPSYEPVLALIGTMTVLIARVVESFQSQETNAIIGRLLLPVKQWRDRRKPRAELKFDSLSGTRAINHSVKAWSVWDGQGPTTWTEVRHRQGTGSWTTPYRFEGHSIELKAQDIDGDGKPEVIVRYACGGHTRVVNIFRIDMNGFLTPIPGAEVGSDWPEILIEDRDGDGKIEIYAKQRDWERVPVQNPITEIYVYRDGKFQKKK
jgi:hypothetical protein